MGPRHPEFLIAFQAAIQFAAVFAVHTVGEIASRRRPPADALREADPPQAIEPRPAPPTDPASR